MKPNYEINNLMAWDDCNCILAKNYPSINLIANYPVSKNNFHILTMLDEYVVAIFKIKWK
jgi:hypothetical protein